MIQTGARERASSAVDTVAQGFARFFQESTGVPGDIAWKVVVSSLVVLALVVVRRLVLRAIEKRVEDQTTRYFWGKGTAYVAFGLGFLFLASIWLEGLEPRTLGTFFGLLSAGVAIALKDPLSNLAGWLFIVWRRPFDLGDRIQIGDHAGDVVDRRIFQFTLLEIGNWVDADQSTGRIIHVPNADVFTKHLANYTAGFEYLWHEVRVLVTFESDWKKAKDILEEVAEEVASGVVEEAERSLRRAARKWLIFYSKLTPVVYTDVKDSGVQLTVRYLVKPRQRRGTTQAIWEGVLERLAAEPDIDLAYPTRRLYYNMLEGKSGARAAIPEGLAGMAGSSREGDGSAPVEEPPRGPGEPGGGEGPGGEEEEPDEHA